jgi:type IV pilus assembly protein PilV
MNMPNRRSAAGFSMIEVLVSLLITVVGVLGMVALQSKAIPYTQDSVQRNTAIMLVEDLIEIVRTSGKGCTADNGCVKAPGAAFPDPPSACIPTPSALSDQVNCWAARAGAALPGNLTNSFYICRSVLPGDAGAGACAVTSPINTEVEIQVAWTVKSASDCMNGNNGNAAGVCTYRMRTRM